MLPAHPLPGGGWRAQRDGRGRLDGPLHGPGSEGGGGGFAAVFIMPPIGAPLHHFVVPLPPDERWEASLKGAVSIPHKMG